MLNINDLKEKQTTRFLLITLSAIILITGGLWFFAEIADEVIEGDTHEFDKAILLAMRNPQDKSDPWGPGWFKEMGRDLTSLGGLAVLTLITAGCVGGLIITKHHKTAYLILFSVIGGILLSFALKNIFGRPRPDLVPHGSIVYSQSFPSGHAMVSTVTYLTLGFLLAGTFKEYPIRIYIVVISLLVAVLVGLSRVYLGVHWPTDVLAGWALGGSWALLCWFIAYWFRKKGKIRDSE